MEQNTGYQNTGYQNTGDQNTGDRNTGDQNTGNRNAGNRNAGNRNTGYQNTGYQNTGYQNTGNRNTGDRNTGDQNTGNQNTGNRNAGNRNAGNRNTGNRNTGDLNTGYLNTVSPKQGLLFNKLVDLWDDKGTCIISFPSYFYFDVPTTDRIERDDMTEEEKGSNFGANSIGGFLRVYEVDKTLRRYRKESFDKAEKEDVAKTLELPGFDYSIFEEITGITKDDFDRKLGCVVDTLPKKLVTVTIDGMAKTYKHRTLGWIAVQEKKAKYKGQYAIFNGGDFALKEKNDNPSSQPDRVYMMYPELIENSSDREEVVEKDWKILAREYYIMKMNTQKGCSFEDFKEAIEKHAPQQKKFTTEECLVRAEKKSMDTRNGYRIADFLKDHGLLSS